MTTQRSISIIFLTIGPLLWAGNFVVGRAVHELVDPFVLNYLRWAVAGVLVLPFLLMHRHAIRAELFRNGASLVALTLLGIVGFNWVLYAGLSRTEGTVGGLVFAVTPFLILLLASAWTARKPATTGVIGCVGAFLGVALVLWDTSGVEAGSDGTGPALVFGSAILWALYSVMLQTTRIRLPAVATFATTVWLGLVLLTPFALARGTLAAIPSAPPEVFAAAAYLGVGASVVAFCCWHAGIARVGAANAAIFMHLVPFFAVILSAVFLGETLQGSKLIGLVVIALSLAATQVTAHGQRRAMPHSPEFRQIRPAE